jgi:hypothetical protein
VARPSKYKPEYAEQARKICQLGATDQQLADFFEVSCSTLNLWKIEHPEFSESLKLGKELPDSKVEHSLYMRAVGYSHPEDDIRVIENQIVVTPTIKHYPPDTTACIFWLKNRRPDLWRANPDIDNPEASLPITLNFVTAKKTNAVD